MTSYHVPKPGDKVKLPEWSHDEAVVVLAVDGDVFWGYEEGTDDHHTYLVNLDWQEVRERPELPVMPDQWAVIYPKITGGAFWSSPSDWLTASSNRNKTGAVPVVGWVRYTATDDIVWADDVAD